MRRIRKKVKGNKTMKVTKWGIFILMIMSLVHCQPGETVSPTIDVFADVSGVTPELNGPSVIQNFQQSIFTLSATGIAGDNGGRIYGMIRLNGHSYYSDNNRQFSIVNSAGTVEITVSVPDPTTVPYGYYEIWGQLFADTPTGTNRSNTSDTTAIYNRKTFSFTTPDTSLQQTINGIGTYLLQGYVYDNCYGDSGATRDFGPNPGSLSAITGFDHVDKSNSFYAYRRSFAYDIAAGAIAFTMLRQQDAAGELLDLLTYIMNSDGSIGFSLNTYGDNFYHMENKKSGTIAWCGYAMAFYERFFNDTRFREPAEKIAAYLTALQVQNTRDDRYGLIKGSDSAQWCNVEHNVDAYFFFDLMNELTGDSIYFNTAELIKDGLLERLWNNREGRFNTAVQGDGALNREKVLDANSWGAIFLIAVSENTKAYRALEYVEQHFFNSHDSVRGYKPYSGQIVNTATPNNWDAIQMVWSEGSLGVALAYLKLGETQKAQEIMDQITLMQNSNGLIRYASFEIDDFVTHGSAAGSNWFILVKMAQQDTKWLNGFW
jgi:hypothetical protein